MYIGKNLMIITPKTTDCIKTQKDEQKKKTFDEILKNEIKKLQRK